MFTWVDREFRLEVYKLLKAEGTIDPGQFEYKRNIIRAFQGHKPEELRQALHDLTTRGLATLTSHGTYEILAEGRRRNPDEFLYDLIEDTYDESKKRIKRYDWLHRTTIVFMISIVTAALMFIFLWRPVGFPVEALGVMFVAPFVLAWLWDRWADRHRIGKEKRLGTRLLDAYLLIRNKDDHESAERAIRQVSRSLRRPFPTDVWDTLYRDRKNLAKIGSDLDNILVPAIVGKTHSKSDLGEVMVRIASLLFEASPESVMRAISDTEPSMFGGLPIKGEPHEEVVFPILEQFSKWRQKPFLRFLVAFAVLTLGICVVGSLHAWIRGAPWQPTTEELVTYFIGLVVGAAAVGKFTLEP